MAQLIANAQSFYSALNRNNSKDWWLSNKSTYDTELKAPAHVILDTLTPQLAALTDGPVKAKLFRAYRDVRFSKDKTPYHTHLHMMWELDSGARQNPVFFFGIGLDYVTAGAGIMGFDKHVLADWRKFVDLDTDRITGILCALNVQGYRLRDPALKRVPPPYAKDHPAAHLLRMKGVTASRTITDPNALHATFTDLWPLNQLLIQVADS